MLSLCPVVSTVHLIHTCRREALLAISLGHLVIAIVIVLTGTIGTRLRVPFPILTRSSFGFWFSYFSVITLIILGMFWFGVQTFIGSECVYQVWRLPISLFVENPSFCSLRY
jgi:cytosine/uracil/thiamine/allantoin permease